MDTAVILAAGKGTKIWPYNLTRQKSTIPILNKPNITHLVDSLTKLNFHNIFVVVGYLEEQVKEALLGFDQITYLQQLEQKGSSHALSLVMDKIKSQNILVLYGDIVLEIEDLHNMTKSHLENNADITAMIAPLKHERPQDWICANLSQNNIISSFSGHPRGGNFRTCGAFAFSYKCFPFLKHGYGFFKNLNVGGMPPLEMELTHSINLMIEKNFKVNGYINESLFVDIDKPWHILEANNKMLEKSLKNLKSNIIEDKCSIAKSAVIDGYVHLKEGSILGQNVIIKGNLIADNNAIITNGAILMGNIYCGKKSLLRNYCEISGTSIIGENCKVGHASEFSGILMNNSYLYHYCEIYGIVGMATDIGAATVCGNLRFDDNKTIHKIGKRKEFPSSDSEAVFLGDFCRTGVNSILMPGVKVGPWSIIGPGVILNEDLPANTIVFNKQELVKKEWGPQMYGW